MERFKICDGSASGHCCFEATVVDTRMPRFIGADGQQVYDAVCECFSGAAAEEVCIALNAAEEHKKLMDEFKAAGEEIGRLSAEVQHWMEARRAAISAGEIMHEELKTLREEIKIAREEIDRLRARAAE